jgi:GGDEF domain-containing protein
MTTKFKVVTAGAVFLALSIFLYFSVRFKYVERDFIASLVAKTNRIVSEYHAMEERLALEKKAPSQVDLSEFLASIHKKNRDIALMAITDPGLNVRLSSKNDQFIRSSELFETILKDFTQDAFKISRENPYVVRYYDEKTTRGVEQLKFYIFINRAGVYRFLIVYPYLFGGKLFVRTALEVALVVMSIIIIFAALYIALMKKRLPAETDDRHTIELSLEDRPVSRGDGAVSRDASSIASDTLSGYVRDLFIKISRAYGADSLSLYIFHQSGRLIKTMELIGNTFLRIDSVSFDTIDVDNEAGREMRNGATMVMEDGRKIILPLVHNNSFIGCVTMIKRSGAQGSEIRELKSAMGGILKNIHDYIVVNDVMTDPGTGLYSKLYFNLKYDECRKSWANSGKVFSVMVIKPFDDAEHINDIEKNTAIKLIAPSIADSIKHDGIICRYDDYVAVILNDTSLRKARGMARDIQGSLSRYCIKINTGTTVRVASLIGLSSIDTADQGQDCIGIAIRQLNQTADAS